MGIRRHTCYSAECATPGCKPWDDGTPHWPTEAQALADATDPDGYGWTLIDGVLRCRDCTATHQCEQSGHQWSHWIGDPTVRLAQEVCDRCSDTRWVAVQAT
jgi:hypothetical protein